MKLSRLEGAIVLITAVFLSFSLGWYLRGEHIAQPLLVEAQRTLRVTETFIPAPEVPPQGKGQKDGAEQKHRQLQSGTLHLTPSPHCVTLSGLL